MVIQYKDILKSVIKITWENKFLWFFGLFAAFLAGGITYRGVYSNNNGGFIEGWEKIKSTGVFEFSIFSKIYELSQADPVRLFATLLIILIVAVWGIFIFWLAVVSQGSLINGVAKLHLNKKTNFQDSFRSGVDNFWSIFLLKVIEKILTLILLSILLLPFIINISASDQIWQIFLYYLLILILFVVVLFLSLITRYAMSYRVIRNNNVFESIQAGINLLKNNLLLSIEASVIIFALTFLIGFIILMSVAALSIPFIFLLFVFQKIAFAGGIIFLLVAGIMAIFILMILTGGIISTFGDSFWTVVFINLVKEKKKSFIGYLFNFNK